MMHSKFATMSVDRSIFPLLCVLWSLLEGTHGHGMITSPRSRNWLAHGEGTEGVTPGVPKAEYCQHCLNQNTGVCGYAGGNNYDNWLDSAGKPMPWTPQDVYRSGDIITIKTTLTAHHGGHMEIKACPNGRASTQACLDDPNNRLTFVRDVLYNLPADPNYPERGYYGGWDTMESDFWMEYKLPDGLVGDEVLIQVRILSRVL
jgi:hypothetical protein